MCAKRGVRHETHTEEEPIKETHAVERAQHVGLCANRARDVRSAIKRPCHARVPVAAARIALQTVWHTIAIAEALHQRTAIYT